MLTTSLLIGLAATFAALAIAAYKLPEGAPRPTKAAGHTEAPRGVWPHEAPITPFSVAQAHQQMRLHRTCNRDDCARKDAAWMTLVDAGHIRPRLPLIGGIP
jgi:hypothetical protein